MVMARVRSSSSEFPAAELEFGTRGCGVKSTVVLDWDELCSWFLDHLTDSVVDSHERRCD